MGGKSSRTEIIYKTDPQLTALINNYSRQNENLNKQISDLTTKYNKEIKELQSSLADKLKEATQKIENEFKEKEIAKEKEIKEKEEKANESYINLTNNFMIEFLNEIKREFNNNKTSFCKEKIEQYNEEKILNLIYNISYFEKIEDVSISQLKEIIKNLSKNSNNLIEHLNILLIGPSGVGKSTLINRILDLPEEEKALTSSNECCTKEIKEYTSKTYPFLRLYDSRGIEKDENYDINKMKKEISEFVNKKELTNDPDKYIHCIWYCITGNRFEKVEKNCLIELSNLYDNSNLPIIVVYTKALSKKDYLPAKEKVDELQKNLLFIDIMSEPYDIEIGDSNTYTVKRKNLDILLKKSIDKAINAIKSSCYSSLKECTKNEINNILKIENENLKINVHNKIVNLISAMDTNCDERHIILELLNIFKTIFITYLFGDNSLKDINNNSKEICTKFLEEYFELIMSNYMKELNPIVNEKAIEGTQKFLTIQNDVIIKFEGHLKTGKIKNEIEGEIKNKIINSLKNLAENFCKKNAALFIAKPIQKKFADKYQKILLELLNNSKEISSEILENSKGNFEKLKKEINNITYN